MVASLQPQVPVFDSARGAWILSRYNDVLTALRDPALPAGPSNPRMRELAASAYSPARLDAWRAELEPLAASMFDGFANGRAVDLVGEFAIPWSLAAALAVNGNSGEPDEPDCGADSQSAGSTLVWTRAGTRREESRRGRQECLRHGWLGSVSLLQEIGASAVELSALARDVFDAGAEPDDPAIAERARQATVEMAREFPGERGPLDLQAFVALSQSLAAFLGNAFLALLEHPVEMKLIADAPDLLPQAVEELLRLAGPSRAVFRQAGSALEISGVRIEEGDRVILMLESSNRDPERFPDPERLDPRRPACRHLAFGAGPHACVGAALIRMAASTALGAFIRRFSRVPMRHSAQQRPGFAIRSLSSLQVLTLTSNPHA